MHELNETGLLLGVRPDSFTEAPVGPRMRELVTRFILAAPGLPKCRHLPAGPPDAGDGPCWLASSREMIRCLPCAMAVAMRLEGTEADATCDWCQRSAAEIGGVSLDCNGVTVMAGLCPECSDADKADLAP